MIRNKLVRATKADLHPRAAATTVSRNKLASALPVAIKPNPRRNHRPDHGGLVKGGGEKRSPSDGLPDDRLMNVERKYAGPAQSVRMESVSRPAEQLHEILTDGRRHPRRDDLLDLLTQEF